jgi:recombination protein RecR
MLPELESLVHQISQLPGIGRRSAARIAFHLLSSPESSVKQLAEGLIAFKRNIEKCECCGAIRQAELLCSYCEKGSKPDIVQICVVEQPSDIYAIESSGEFHGSYHVLHGALSPLDGIGPEKLTLNELQNRVNNLSSLTEIILATNPSMEGNTTANYINEMFKENQGIKITRIASGLALGSQLEYADSMTISQSLKARTLFE